MVLRDFQILKAANKTTGVIRASKKRELVMAKKILPKGDAKNKMMARSKSKTNWIIIAGKCGTVV